LKKLHENNDLSENPLSKEQLSKEQRKRVIESQRYALIQHGYHPHSLLWSNTEVQELRFKILADIGIQQGDSVLDVGCGFGDLAGYLQQQDKSVDFMGIDVSEELLLEGRKHFPHLELIQGDLLDFNPAPQSYDYVTLSGALNRKFDNAEAYTHHIIKRMFETCKKGIAFNLLDARHEWTKSRWDLQSFYPDDIKAVVSELSTNVTIVDGYLENDFSVYVKRDAL
jgi:cyclopropane fatty-acyl-phospholipid synthase-like methyltransferase